VTDRALILILTGLALIGGCAKPPQPGPAAARFWQEALAAEFGNVYERFSFNDRSVKSKEEFVQGFAFTPDDSSVFRVTKAAASFKLAEAQISGDTARINVSVRVTEVLVNYYRKLLWKIDRMVQADTAQVPRMVTLEGSNVLVREDNAWFIFGDWETQRRIEGELAKLRLDYLAKIKVRNIKVRVDQSVRKYYLSFDLVNAGDRTLKFVQVLVTCLNKEGRACQVLTDNPVSRKNGFLAPGGKRRVRLDLTTAPVEWSLRTDIKVVDCEFSDQ